MRKSGGKREEILVRRRSVYRLCPFLSNPIEDLFELIFDRSIDRESFSRDLDDFLKMVHQSAVFPFCRESRRLEFNGERDVTVDRAPSSDCIVSNAAIQYVGHNVSWVYNQPEACFQRISQHPLDPRTTFRQITPIPLIEYISIHQRRVSRAAFPLVRYIGENQKRVFFS